MSDPSGSLSRRGDGLPIHPGTGVVPILKEVRNGQLAVIGTGFYITRYGLVATAKHVVEDIIDDSSTLIPSVVAHLHGDNELILRQVLRAHFLRDIDVAVIQADNYLSMDPPGALQNLRGTLSLAIPRAGTPLVTYAYPENRILDFNQPDEVPGIAGDYFVGGVLRFVEQPEHPFLRFPYFETSVEVRSGASGGPVFLPNGHIVGINCRGWDFRGGEHEAEPLSYIAPVSLLLDLELDTWMIPPHSWEARQLGPGWESKRVTLGFLAEHGLVDVQRL